jgi:hypothetical protein
MLFGSGELPTGIIRTSYGGEPPPETDMETFPHCVGWDLNCQVYASAKRGRARARTAAARFTMVVERANHRMTVRITGV